MDKVNFEELFKIESVEGLIAEEKVNTIGMLFDLAFDNKSIEGIEKGFKLADQIDINELTDELNTVLLYDLSNGWSYLRKLKYRATINDWNFQIDELTKEIYYLRKSLYSEGFNKVEIERQCQIYTNLGNAFSYIGRFIEAQEFWNKALILQPKFSMARGNKANGLYYYGSVLYDNIHRSLFLVFAYHDLKETLKYPEYLHDEAKIGVEDLFNHLTVHLSILPKNYLEKRPTLNDFELGNDIELQNYRVWCLENTLYINPLNDLGCYTDSCHDCLNLPTLILSINRPPAFLDIFNQMKQEFATARYMYYSSLLAAKQHYSDIDVPLVETVESIYYSYYVEQLKISFRLTYSILDKIAYLLNDYLELNINNDKVNFRKLWTADNKTLRTFFLDSKNWALRGLYWLSKDIYDKEIDFDSVLDPDSKEISVIRNFIEHKGFKVVPDFEFFKWPFTESDISYSITRKDFQKKTLKLLKLTRAAIMYTAIAISHEEQLKDYNDIKAMPIGGNSIGNRMRF